MASGADGVEIGIQPMVSKQLIEHSYPLMTLALTDSGALDMIVFMAMNPFSPEGQGSFPNMRNVRMRHMAQQPPDYYEEHGQFGSFRASLLYCPKCQTATPTRERLLLVLPTGNLYEYFCIHCGTSTGSKTDHEQHDVRLYAP